MRCWRIVMGNMFHGRRLCGLSIIVTNISTVNRRSKLQLKTCHRRRLWSSITITAVNIGLLWRLVFWVSVTVLHHRMLGTIFHHGRRSGYKLAIVRIVVSSTVRISDFPLVRLTHVQYHTWHGSPSIIFHFWIISFLKIRFFLFIIWSRPIIDRPWWGIFSL